MAKIKTFRVQYVRNQIAVDSLTSVNMAGDVIKKAEMFCYLGNVLCTEGGIQEVVTKRVRTGWKRFKDVASVLCKKSLLVKLREVIYKMYIKSEWSLSPCQYRKTI